MATHPRWTLEFEALPEDGWPPEIRVRLLLKHAGRYLGLKCVRLIGDPIEGAPSVAPAAPPAAEVEPPGPAAPAKAKRPRKRRGKPIQQDLFREDQSR